jgi:hypothetical protein
MQAEKDDVVDSDNVEVGGGIDYLYIWPAPIHDFAACNLTTKIKNHKHRPMSMSMTMQSIIWRHVNIHVWHLWAYQEHTSSNVNISWECQGPILQTSIITRNLTALHEIVVHELYRTLTIMVKALQGESEGQNVTIRCLCMLQWNLTCSGDHL